MEDTEALKKILDELAELFKKNKANVGIFLDSLRDSGINVKLAGKMFKDSAEQAKHFKEGLKAVQTEVNKAESSLNRHRKGYDELHSVIKRQKESLEDMIDEEEYHLELMEKEANLLKDEAAAREKREEIAERRAKLGEATATREILARRELTEATNKAIAGLITVKSVMSGFNKVGEVAGKFTTSMISSGDGITVASDLMKSGIDIANSGAQTVGGGMQSVGMASVAASGKVTGFSGSLIAAGAAVQLFSQGLSATAKIAIDFLGGQFKALGEGFMQLSSSGALFADGMTGMRNASAAAGLTTQQMSNVVKQNSDAMAKSGLGVTGAIKQIGAVNKSFPEFRTQLMGLGYSFEEQAGLMADVMSNMQKAGRNPQNEAEVKSATESYAKNLRTIAAITGDDAKKRLDAAKKDMEGLDIQAAIMEREKEMPGYYNQVQNQLATMPQAFKEMYMQKLSPLGVVTDAAANTLMASVPGLENVFDRMKAVVNDGTLTDQQKQEKQAQLNAEMNQLMRDNMGNLKIFGLAARAGAGGITESVNKLGAAGFGELSGQTKEANKAAVDSVTEQYKSLDGLTKKYIDITDVNQKRQVALQDAAILHMDAYATALKKANDLLLAAIEKLGGKETIGEKISNMFEAAAPYLMMGVTMFGGKLITGASTAIKGLMGLGTIARTASTALPTAANAAKAVGTIAAPLVSGASSVASTGATALNAAKGVGTIAGSITPGVTGGLSAYSTGATVAGKVAGAATGAGEVAGAAGTIAGTAAKGAGMLSKVGGLAKGLGVAGSIVDAGAGLYDLGQGKAQTELSGLDYISPMRLGMRAGHAINQTVEGSTEKGDSIGTKIFDWFSGTDESKINAVEPTKKREELPTPSSVKSDMEESSKKTSESTEALQKTIKDILPSTVMTEDKLTTEKVMSITSPELIQMKDVITESNTNQTQVIAKLEELIKATQEHSGMTQQILYAAV